MTDKSFVNDVFNHQYHFALGPHHRGDTFRIMFQKLEELKKNKYLIVETGTTRMQDNFYGDGQSTRLFNSFVNVKYKKMELNAPFK